MEGAVALAESIFQTSVRLGIPEKFNGMESVLKNPIYATALGLIGFGFDQIKQGYTLENNKTFLDRAFGFLRNNYWLLDAFSIEFPLLGFLVFKKSTNSKGKYE